MNDDGQRTSIAEFGLHEDALPNPLFERLAGAVRQLGDERMKNNGSYTTTFWFPRDAAPTNIAEEAINKLLTLVDPGPECIGTEWWLGRLAKGKELRFHFDRDLALKRKTGKSVHPLISSVLYLNTFPSSPTVILDQVLSPDGKSRIPKEPEFGKSIEAVANQYVVFPGNLRHGVIPDWDKTGQDSSSMNSAVTNSAVTDELRLTLLVNYWHQRPQSPICIDYDGTIYSTLRKVHAARTLTDHASPTME